MLCEVLNLVLTGKSPDFLIVVAFVTEKDVDIHGLRLINDGAIWLSRFFVVVMCRLRIAFTFISTRSVTLSC